jgi:thiamine biosynthesis lipoprotein
MAPTHDLTTRREVAHMMGMPISLALRGRHAQTSAGRQAWREALATLTAADCTFSTYKQDSAISRLNRGEVDLYECPPEVVEVLEIAEQATTESDGAFDVWLSDRDGVLRLDPSGIVKGWAVERAVRAFDGLEETDVCLSAGGDMVCRTRAPGSQGWRIGIENPHDTAAILAVAPIRDGAVATSGTVHRGRHIVDPRTATTPDHFASLTVVGDNLTWVDIDATAAFVMGSAAVAWLESRGRVGVAVDAAGTATVFGRG